MIRTTLVNGKLRFEIDGKRGKAVAMLTPKSALSLRRRIGDLIADVVDEALDNDAFIPDILECR